MKKFTFLFSLFLILSVGTAWADEINPTTIEGKVQVSTADQILNGHVYVLQNGGDNGRYFASGAGTDTWTATPDEVSKHYLFQWKFVEDAAETERYALKNSLNKYIGANGNSVTIQDAPSYFEVIMVEADGAVGFALKNVENEKFLARSGWWNTGYTNDLPSASTDNAFWTLHDCPSVVEDGYYMFVSKATDRRPYLHNDFAHANNPNNFTLQANTVPSPLENGYIWKVETYVNDIYVVNGQGTPIKANVSGNPSYSKLTVETSVDGYFCFTNRLNASAGTQALSDGTRTVTTWSGSASTHNDNNWKLESVPTESIDVYTVEIIGGAETSRVMLNATAELAFDGGFFFVTEGTTPVVSDFTVSEREGYLSTVTVEGKTVKVVYTIDPNAKTIVPIKRVSVFESGKKYMLFGAGMYNSTPWTGFVYNDGTKAAIDFSKQPSTAKVQGSDYLWMVETNGTGYKLISAANNENVNAAGVFGTTEDVAIIDYSVSSKRCGPDVYVMSEDGTGVLRDDVTSSHKVWTISNTIENWGWANNAEGMLFRADGYFPYAFYEVYEFDINQLEAYEVAKAALSAQTGLGYLKAESELRTAVETLFASDPTTVDNYAAELNAAVSAFRADIQVPEEGRAYTITNMQKNGTTYQLHYTEENGLAVGEAGVDYTDPSAVFVCKKVGDKYVFVYGSGKYLTYKGNGGEQLTGAADTYSEPTRSFSLKSAYNTLPGTFYMLTKRADEVTDGAIVILSNRNFDGYGNSVGYADGYSNLMKFEEVEYPNAPQLNAVSDIEGVEALATFSAPFATVAPEGVTAYIATESADKSYVTMTELEGAVPANTGVVLAGVAGKVTMVPAAGELQATVEGNLLGHSAGAAKDIPAEENAYVLTGGEDGVAFYRVSATNRTLGMNKAYLVLNETQGAVKMSFGAQTTGLEQTEVQEGAAAAPVFDLSGRRVMQAVKGGVYIQNGKKFIVK